MTVSPFEATSSIEGPIPDLPLLRKVLDHIDAHPEEWDQRDFECGTTRCVAGWAIAFSFDAKSIYEIPDKGDSAFCAQKLLGLTTAEADALFYYTITHNNKESDRAAVQVIAERIAARAGEVL